MSDQNLDRLRAFDEQHQAVTRTLGGVQMGLGLAGTIGGAALCTSGVGCAAGAGIGVISYDQAQAGSQQLVSGIPQETIFNQSLQALGLSPQTASLVELGAGLGLGAAANKILAQSSKILSGANAPLLNGNGPLRLPELDNLASGKAAATASASKAQPDKKTVTQQVRQTLEQVGNSVKQGLDNIVDQVAYNNLMRSGGAFDAQGNPLLDLNQLTTAQKGKFGELFGEHSVKHIIPDGEKLARMQGIGDTGIDDLYKVSRPDVDYVIVEYKFVGNHHKPGSQSLAKTKDGKQGSQEWITGSGRIGKAVEDRKLTADIQQAVIEGRTETWVVTTRPNGSTQVEVLDSAGKVKNIDYSKILHDIDLTQGALP